MLRELAAAVQCSRGLAHKRDIAGVAALIARGARPPGGIAAVPVGDDCAAIVCDGGYLLFAIEGFMNEFVAQEPWFAGYCGIMVNASDVYAMGGRPMAVVDAVWSQDRAHGEAILAGMVSASQTYRIPIVGGHSNARCDREQLAVAILGRATRLLTSFDAHATDVLLAAIDLRGRYREPFSHWDASTQAWPERLRADLEILPMLAETGLCVAAKDISQAGVIGTALMFMECSGVGGVIEVEAVPRPAGVPRERWLVSTFPSYGFLLSVPPCNVADVRQRFADRDIACAVIGHFDRSQVVKLRDGATEAPLWDFRTTPLLACARPALGGTDGGARA